MPLRAKLLALTKELRHARTDHLPMAMAERAQHTIVRIEELLASPIIDPHAVDILSMETRKILDECNAFLKSR